METAEGLYVDPESGRVISTHSMLKTFRRCPKQVQYKYVERLKPKFQGRPLRLGTWMHRLQEIKGKGGDWQAEHELMKSTVWAKLFDEEKDEIGDLPRQAEILMASYNWYYQDCAWRIVESEITLECDLPDGSIYRCRIDWIVEDQYGLWIVDHKWLSRLPSFTQRILDSQSADYVWCALKNKIPVQGFIWDYALSKVPTVPTLTKTGLISRWAKLDTDYLTAARFFKEHFSGGVPQRYRPKMRMLKAQRYAQGVPQSSSHFRRNVLERSKMMLEQVAREAYHTHKRMNSYPFDRPEIVERVPDRSCDWMCGYSDLCTAELMTGSRPVNWRQRYKVGDPLEYYRDEAPTREDI